MEGYTRNEVILRTGALVVSALISLGCILFAAEIHLYANAPDEYGKVDPSGKLGYFYYTDTPLVVLALLVAGGFYWAGSQATTRPFRIGAALFLAAGFVALILSQL